MFVSENDPFRVRVVYGADDRSPSQHDNGLDARDGAGQGPAGGVRAARPTAAGQDFRLLRHGQGRGARQLIQLHSMLQYILIRDCKFYLCKNPNDIFSLSILLY